MLAERLKEETLANHQQLEKMLVGRMKAIRTTQNYIDLLQLFYSYFGGLEKQIDQHLDQNLLPDYAERRKSAALAQDIEALGGTPGQIAGETALPTIHSALQALAALYVIEGSTLGGKFISKMIAQQLQIINGKGLSFFYSYGPDTEAMWATFKEAVNRQATLPGEQKEVVEAANQTFIKFKAWAERELVQPGKSAFTKIS
jgi:heme oxygenase